MKRWALIAVLALVDCDDCDGVGWSKPVAFDPAAARARRIADHDAYVAEHGVGASCGPSAWFCSHR